MVDGPPGRKLAGQKAPGAAALEDVEDGVQDLTRRMDLGAPSLVGGGQMLLDVPEFFLGKVCRIAHHGPKRRPSTPTFRIYQTVSRRVILGCWTFALRCSLSRVHLTASFSESDPYRIMQHERSR